MKLGNRSDSVLYDAQDAKTQKPVRPKTVQLVIATEGWSPRSRTRHALHLILILDLALARKISRLLRRSATRAEQRTLALARKRSPKRRSTLRKSAGIAAEIRAGRKL